MTTDKQPEQAAESATVMETVPSSTAPVAMPTDNKPVVEPATPKPDADVTMETTPSDPTQKSEAGKMIETKILKERVSSEAESSAKVSEIDFVSELFTSWSCIVATVLGCYPLAPSADRTTLPWYGDRGVGHLDDPFHDWPSQGRGLSSVRSLDAFTSHLVLNASETCITKLTSTIVKKINSCLAESNQHSVDLLDLSVHDVDFSRSVDETTVAVLVGKRFLESVIRVLGMEHSRVKNTFAEMQQVRAHSGGGMGGRGDGVRGEGVRERDRIGVRADNGDSQNSSQMPRNVVQVIK